MPESHDVSDSTSGSVDTSDDVDQANFGTDSALSNDDLATTNGYTIDGSTFSSYPSTYSYGYGARYSPKIRAESSLVTLAIAFGLIVVLAGVSVAVFEFFLPARSPLIGILCILGACLLAIMAVFLTRFLLMRKRAGDGTPAQDWAQKTLVPLNERESNRQSLNKYQELTQRQAGSSYRIAQVSILIGLVILACGAAIALYSDDVTGQIIVGALAAVGSAISGYVGATSIRMYQRAQMQMNFYYAQPLVQSYIIQAQELCEKLSDARRDASYEKIIDRTLEGASVAGFLITRGSEDGAAGTNQKTRVKSGEQSAQLSSVPA